PLALLSFPTRRSSDLDGKTADEIIAQLDHMKSKIRAYFMVDDLTNLQKGGRLSHAQAVLGGLLKIKPVLHFVDKVIVPFEKIRTDRKSTRLNSSHVSI